MKKLIEFILSLFGYKKESKLPEVDVVPVPDVKPPKKPDLIPVPDNTLNIDEPLVSDPNGTITSFLWKNSDTYPYGAVISVSSDTLRAEDVTIQILDKKGKLVDGKTTYNSGAGTVKRGNQLPNHKYGRFNFKPGKTVDYYVKYAPLKVSFFFNGKLVKVMGKDFIEVKKPKERLDLK